MWLTGQLSAAAPFVGKLHGKAEDGWRKWLLSIPSFTYTQLRGWHGQLTMSQYSKRREALVADREIEAELNL